MKTLPLFFALASFSLAIGTGCAATQSTSAKKSTHTVAKATTRIGDLLGPDSLYSQLDPNSPLNRLMRGEAPDSSKKEERKLRPGQAIYRCGATGQFKLGSSPQYLLMQRYCLNPASIGTGVLDGFTVEDMEAPALSSKPNWFAIPFERAVVEVQPATSKPHVVLYYEDDMGAVLSRALPASKNATYAYNFEDLVPDNVLPELEEWVLDREEIEAYRRKARP